MLSRAFGASLLVLATVGLTACSGTNTDTDAAAADWQDRMQTYLSDPAGQGGGGGDVAASTQSPSKVSLGTITLGEYDVLAVCEGTAAVHVVVSADAKIGGATKVASSDIPCGATVRIPVTFPSGSAAISASRKAVSTDSASDTSDSAQWYVSIVSRGWEPGIVSYG